ncbi:c-type cytochrome biogenesis protein CcmI [Phyllobacterium sp. 21LDTY02-6]|uniref:c-type cytochrome biogenesis protein CcmI n=1 Tax=unclassified Phyllobacterium TaxID=2638441 RepID=UPI0020225525|nr:MULTISPECIES: c-type cytochrome biogenesis protein CcmI [unclassified Phyllobacterium]MCO4318331.1 c-type cytochrome biogenesis protein CcmI [Phyllobacterium sp. 21LDTY02-6]MCX8281252.1 c-type cytochrome biogenesis protein CcmI [Phyllobacterium sp. 0TCS1.6C]MCX8296092.1 c-type cytochrome biogenesis protein CcmI [Phyllobacterium sp. 0TCS1.6A]
MIFWIVAALLTVGATLMVLLPLTRRIAPPAVDSQHDVEVYRDQLVEVNADERRGLIDATSAEQARAEIGRRLIEAARMAAAEEAVVRPVKSATREWVTLVTVIAIPALSWALYTNLGSPELPAQPLAERLSKPADQATPAELVARAEAHLKLNPDDGEGWEVLAPIYLRMGRPADAVTAYRNTIRIRGDSAARQLGLGQAMTQAAGGKVTPEAEAVFRRALELDPQDMRPQFFIIDGWMQQGRLTEARDMIRELLAKAPADVPWREQAQAALTRLDDQIDGDAPDVSDVERTGPSSAEIEAAAGMSGQDRAEMIEGMVVSLAQKLEKSPDDVEGWERLVRSYVVLNRPNDALAALGRAKQALAAEDAARLDSVAAELGLVDAPEE